MSLERSPSKTDWSCLVTGLHLDPLFPIHFEYSNYRIVHVFIMFYSNLDKLIRHVL